MSWLEVIAAACKFYHKLPDEIRAYPNASDLLQIMQVANYRPPSAEEE